MPSQLYFMCYMYTGRNSVFFLSSNRIVQLMCVHEAPQQDESCGFSTQSEISICHFQLLMRAQLPVAFLAHAKPQEKLESVNTMRIQ